MLITIAMLIISFSALLTYNFIKTLQKEQRIQLKIWANAIQKKAYLINYTNELFKKIAEEEQKKIEIWANANKEVFKAKSNHDVSFFLDIISKNTTIPVIITDQKGHLVAFRNLPDSITLNRSLIIQEIKKMVAVNPALDIIIKISNKKTNILHLYYANDKIFSELKNVFDNLLENFIEDIVNNFSSMPVIYTDESQNKIMALGNINMQKYNSINQALKDFKLSNDPIPIKVSNQTTHYIFYKDNLLITKLKYYPFLIILVVIGFSILTYFLIQTSRKSEQNQMWVSMTKETAHQLGTPISSIMAWNEFIKNAPNTKDYGVEIEKDIERLNTIIDRFSKIGSIPKFKDENLKLVIESNIQYLSVRIPKKIKLSLVSDIPKNLKIPLSKILFSWVIENVVKNAIDATKGDGEILISHEIKKSFVVINISDNGEGISKEIKSMIFNTGYSTKKRGWGIGLSLVKRIIVDYHKGKIEVESKENKGTKFKLFLPKNKEFYKKNQFFKYFEKKPIIHL